MLTEFGKILRKLRIDCGEILLNMAERLGVTASYLSAVETGKRNVPDDWGDRLAAFYGLDEQAKSELQDAMIQSRNSVMLRLTGVEAERKRTAVMFAREFENLDNEALAKIKDIMLDGSKEHKNDRVSM
jgi:transcriptional regulator with XRE-family HTH domain